MSEDWSISIVLFGMAALASLVGFSLFPNTFFFALMLLCAVMALFFGIRMEKVEREQIDEGGRLKNVRP